MESPVIVIHPGSAHLRIGRASDINCITITNAVAVRGNIKGRVHKDGFLPRCVPLQDVVQELEDSRLRMSHLLQSSPQSNGARRYATPPQQISAFNRRSAPEIIPGHQNLEYLPANMNVVVADDILKIDPNANYNIHFPIKRGQLNVHSGLGGSLFNTLDHLQTILEHAITQKLQIRIRDLPGYKAVLVIPDIFNRTHVKELTNLLLNRLGFGSCFLVQDHVAATFGSGLGHACVVDAGAEKISVSCVEDGVSQASVCLEYGGSDVTQVFQWLLQKCSFPYKEWSPANARDCHLLNRLKEKHCHLNLDICGAQEQFFEVRKPGQPINGYTIQFGDELMIAPLSLFHTELLNLTGPLKMARTKTPSNKHLVDAEDCFDAVYLRETGLTRRGTKEQTENTLIAMDANNGNGEPIGGEDEMDNLENERDVVAKDKDFVLAGSQIIGVDQAILQSIERCSTEEVKKKMLSSILLVGGGTKFSGIEKWLQRRLLSEIPAHYKAEQIEIITSAKEIDPAMTTWKGAAIMSCLESACELWISKADWARQGVKVLRERAPFTW